MSDPVATTPPSPDTGTDRAPVHVQGVLLGAGGDPNVLGLMAFALGLLIFGMGTVGVFPADAIGSFIPVVVLLCGVALIISTLWSLIIAESLLAGAFGIISGFFLSLGALFLGVFHDWYAISAADVPSAQAIFYIMWCCFFLALIIPSLRLPAVYPLIFLLVATLLALGATNDITGPGGNLATAQGAATLAASFFLFYAWVRSSLQSVGVRKGLPGGPVLI
jgi:uncharacterized protein